MFFPLGPLKEGVLSLCLALAVLVRLGFGLLRPFLTSTSFASIPNNEQALKVGISFEGGELTPWA